VSGAISLTTIVTIGLAITGYMVTYWNNVRISQRHERLPWVNRQI
jgi:hypothetical protein